MRNKDRELKTIWAMLAIIILLMLAGFLLLFKKIDNLKSEMVSPVTSPIEPASSTSSIAGVEESNKENSEKGIPIGDKTNQSMPISIETNIILRASSTPDLQPQAALTVLISKATKMNDGTLAIAIKVFTDTATSYSAINLSDYIQIFDPSGNNRKPSAITGAFKAMPPKSAIDGVINFSSNPSETSYILEVGSPENPTFYQFDFLEKTYQQINVG